MLVDTTSSKEGGSKMRGADTHTATLITISLAAALAVSCAGPQPEPVPIAGFAVDGTEGPVDTTAVVFDQAVTHDGNGAFRVDADEPRTARLYELGDLDVENAVLIYQAHVRTEDVDGHVYVEMLCHFPNGEEYFSRALDDPLYGTTEWTLQETPFDLKPGEDPDNVKLNLVINGTGTAWIDDIHVWQAPRPAR
jgi:hypothetical protein